MDSSTKIGLFALAVPGFVALVLLGYQNYRTPEAFARGLSQRDKTSLNAEVYETSGQADADITGRASIIDGDTIEIQGQRIRLHGIDAPETSQFCKNSTVRYSCGRDATNFLSSIVIGRIVACSSKDTDRYGRTVAVCQADNIDLGITMILNGWALAYRKYEPSYILFEDEARRARRGIWAGEFINPKRWRAGEKF